MLDRSLLNWSVLSRLSWHLLNRSRLSRSLLGRAQLTRSLLDGSLLDWSLLSRDLRATRMLPALHPGGLRSRSLGFHGLRCSGLRLKCPLCSGLLDRRQRRRSSARVGGHRRHGRSQLCVTYLLLDRRLSAGGLVLRRLSGLIERQ
jgi:hypothetical protein